MENMKLQSDNLYVLPDGRELIARSVDGLGYHLLDPKLGVAAAPVYFVTEGGSILFWGKATPWTVKDLRDTGRVVRKPLHRLELV